MRKNITYLIFFLILLSCNYSCSQNYLSTNQLELDPITVNTEDQHRAYFASGCFWCVEAIYESLIGVSDVISGYSGGDLANPTYELVNTRLTGHAETIEVVYNPNEITFSNLLKVYFGSQNIEQINGQGPDKGPQYRSIIFYQNENVLFISTHQYPYYPGTGSDKEKGKFNNIYNIPLPAGTNSRQYLDAFDFALKKLKEFRPEFVLISAGFDGHISDPLAQFKLQTEDYYVITKRILETSKKFCNGKVVSILEGGYDLDALRDSTKRHVDALIEFN